VLVVGMVSACHRREWGQYRGILECHECDASFPVVESESSVTGRVFSVPDIDFLCFDDLPCLGAEGVFV